MLGEVYCALLLFLYKKCRKSAIPSDAAVIGRSKVNGAERS
jgi:hypothetical protein